MLEVYLKNYKENFILYFYLKQLQYGLYLTKYKEKLCMPNVQCSISAADYLYLTVVHKEQ
jgi:hypothetical protein